MAVVDLEPSAFSTSGKLISAQGTINVPDRWSKIMKLKTDFLQNKIKDPRNCSTIDPELAASWIRSRDYGVSPFIVGRMIKKQMERSLFQCFLAKQRSLLEITRNVIDEYKGMMLFADYGVILFDPQGLVLIQEDAWLKSSPFDKKEVRQSMVGKYMDEENAGTHAHSLSVNQKRPIQLLGHEHYSIAYSDTIASAVPITDEDGAVIAVLTLITPLVNGSRWENDFIGLTNYSKDLVVTMAHRIQALLSLEYSRNELNAYKNRLQVKAEALMAALDVADDAVVIIDEKGRFIDINHKAMHTFKLSDKPLAMTDLSQFMNDNTVMNLAGKGRSAEMREALHIGNKTHSYLVSIRPVMDEYTGLLNSAVLRFRSMAADKLRIVEHSPIPAVKDFNAVIGKSKEIKGAIKMARLFADCNENVLLVGESGTGKELFAQAIHAIYASAGPFVAINCAAMPRELIESELFGYEGGSFTGADRIGRQGKIELANGGTLFLDEIGDMPLKLQAVLLRTLEDKQVMRVGGLKTKKVDFRLIAATNRDLKQLVREKLFREDLYYRLSVLPIQLPPLRKRKNDILLLCEHFITEACQKRGREIVSLAPAASRLLVEYSWPGNIRELKNAMTYAVNISAKQFIELDDLPVSIRAGTLDKMY
ncbi:sigma 54-interacting transcriptional regulator [Dehalobacter sp. DCM]|uniref:sigma-54 interaction domain-containing protein n=1 Tax=Dehalobacter sp. DCM TaxID=2907827 RepID=UPI0030815CB5|nr:sigma 54-interacting transcriptional regulator [Dehalobacter sp. DCM]